MKRLVAVVLLASGGALAQTAAPAGRGTRPAAPSRPAAASNLSYKDLRYPELRPVTPPRTEDVAFPNGLHLYLLEDHELPLINGTVMVRGGSAFDPADKVGLAVLTARVLLDGGTAATPGVGLSQKVQNLGGEIDATVSENFISISFCSLKESAPGVLDALKQALTAPEFPQDRIDFMKFQARNGIAHRNDDAAGIARRELLKAVFGRNSVYGAQAEYTTIDRINRADLANFFRRYFFPRNAILSLSGDFDSASMKKRIEALFDDWTVEQPSVPTPPAAATDSAPGRYLAVKKDTNATYIAVGSQAGDYLDKDYAALQIAASILGGGPRGRLYRRLGSKVDGLSVSWTPGADHPGLFQIGGTVNPFDTPEVLSAINLELNSLRTSEVSDAELKSAKDSALNSYVFTFDGESSMLSRLTLNAFLKLPADYIPQHQAALAAVSRQDVLRVARERLDPAKMATVVVGNPTGFETPLDATIPIDLTIPPPKPESAPADLASQRRARDLLARAQQAFGGSDKLAKLSDFVAEVTYQFDASAGGAESSSTERWLAPGILRQDTAGANGKISVFCDGKSGWLTAGNNSAPLTGVSLQQMQSELFHVLYPLLLSDRAPGRKLSAVDENTIEIGDEAGQLVKVVLDASTGLVKSLLYEVATTNANVSVIESFSDYRDVSGVKAPFAAEFRVSGQKYQYMIVKKLEINTGLKLQDMEKRP